MKPIISMKDVWFRYSDEGDWVLKGINFELYPGEWVSILGGNGSGKSTMARMMNGLILPVRGEVIVDHKCTGNEAELWDIRKTVGMVFQNPENQIVAMTVEDDIAFGLENLGLEPEEINRRIDEVTELLGLSHLRKREPHRLSGGQKQRLAIAGVLAMRPKVIIFDEATAMLDPKGARDVIHIMEMLQQQGISIIHISHEMDEVHSSDRIMILKKGEIIADGRSDEVLLQAELLSSSGLVPPFAVRVREELERRGVHLDRGKITVKDLAEEIWRFSLRM